MRIQLILSFILVLPLFSAAFAQEITIDTSQDAFAPGEIVEITGTVQGAGKGDLTAIEIKNPEGDTILIRTIEVGPDGSFSLKFKIPESETQGDYEIVANAEIDGKTVTKAKSVRAESGSSAQLDTGSESNGGGCLIATAAYGSELAPKVQQLREIRDSILLNTDSGTKFMIGFNQVYYSFSPTIADWERHNPEFQEFVKITITPMLSTLSILEFAEPRSEIGVLGYGLSVIGLNIGIYLAGPAILVWKIKHLKTTQK